MALKCSAAVYELPSMIIIYNLYISVCVCVITSQYVTYGNDHVHVHCAYFECVSCDLRLADTKVTNFYYRYVYSRYNIQYYVL